MKFFRISDVFPICFSFSLPADTADRKQAEFKNLYLAIILEYSKA